MHVLAGLRSHSCKTQQVNFHSLWHLPAFPFGKRRAGRAAAQRMDTLVPFASLLVRGPIPKAVGREEPSHRSLWLSTLPARAADALRCSKRDDQPEQHLLNAEEQVNSSALTALSATQEGSHLTLLRSYLSKPQVSVAN